MSARMLARLLADPTIAFALADDDWVAVLAAARAERLIGTLGHRCRDHAPPAVAAILAEARDAAAGEAQAMLWEAEMARRALAPLDVPVVLLKGAAYAAAALDAARGRAIGDLDILVPRAALPTVEAALRGAGWEPIKTDGYDDAYYRRWMHELPPLVHRERDRVIDVHHTILPPTARPTPDADALIADAVAIGGGLSILSPADRIVHAAAHLVADGDMAGGLRNLWDIDRLVREAAAADPGFAAALSARAARHGLGTAVARALRLARALFVTPIAGAGADRPSDCLFARCLLARDGWGRETRPVTRLAFYVRSHWMRMPPLLLARHLAIKSGAMRARE